ncbi:MAG: D-2-hydroxyacid dehydrogenase [Prevotella sp.]|nr:D-2-hydroxyacid dehydrogenase [Prevotella sp.]
MEIVILDAFSANPGDLSWEPLRQLGNLTIYDRTAATETVSRAKDADIILTNKVVLRKPELDQLPRLRYIGVLATGYNVVDTAECHRRGIVVTNVPAYSTDSVAQMVFAHLLTVTNHVEHYAKQNRERRWSENPDFCYWDTPLTEIAGKTFGIVGLGNIGRKVAAIAQTFGLSVLAVTSKAANQLPAGVTKATLSDMLSQSDIVSLHCPLTPDTQQMINADTLRLMKPSAILINTGRGPLIDEQAVADALHNGQLYAYCADVTAQEPPAADCPLLDCDNAYLTPHVAWATREARIRLLDIAIGNVAAFVGGTPRNMV